MLGADQKDSAKYAHKDSYKEKTSNSRKGGQPSTTIKTQDPVDQDTHNFPQLWHSRVVKSSNLTFGGYLACITPVLSTRSSLFVVQVLFRACEDRDLLLIFRHHHLPKKKKKKEEGAIHQKH